MAENVWRQRGFEVDTSDWPCANFGSLIEARAWIDEQRRTAAER